MKLLHTFRRVGGRIAAAAVALSIGSASFAQAQEGSREAMLEAFEEAQQVETLTVPFNPPLGESLAYSVVIEKKRSKGDSRMELEQFLTFERIGEGYLLDLDVRALVVGGERVDLTIPEFLDALPMTARPFVMSVEIELDAAGEAVRLRDWETMREMLQDLPNLVAEKVAPERRDAAVRTAQMLFAPLISSTAEDATYAIVKGWPSILGYGGLELEAGEIYGNEAEMGGEIFPTPVPAVLEVSLDRTARGDYRLTQSTEPDAEALSEATIALLQKIDAMSGGKNRESPKDELGDTAMTMTDRLDVVYEEGTGLPLSAVITRAINIGDVASRGDIITITRQN